MDFKNVTRDIIAVLIVIGAIVSLFVAINATGERLLQTLAGIIVGYYFGAGTAPLPGLIGGAKKMFGIGKGSK